MPVRLFHFTSRPAAAAILAHGFQGATSWLSADVESVCGEGSRGALIEVLLDLDLEELGQFAREVLEETWDEATGEFVPDRAIGGPEWYEVPTAVLIDHGKVRLIGEDERKALMMGLDPSAPT